MEEQKDNKEVKMEAVKTGNKEKKTLSYEKLSEIAQKVFEENRYLKHSLHEANETLKMVNRLDYLFRVAEIANSNGNWKFSNDFIERCLSEIETAMTPPKKEEEPISDKSQEN